MDKLPSVLAESQNLRVLNMHDLQCALEVLPTFLSHAGCLPRIFWLTLDYYIALACSEGLRAATNLQVRQCTAF